MSPDRHGLRFNELYRWLAQVVPYSIMDCVPMLGDASHRHYYRLLCRKTSYVVMDSGCTDERTHDAFLNIAAVFQRWGLLVPVVYAHDAIKGFMLLSDLGDQTYLSALNTTTADSLYHSAFKSLWLIQKPKHDAVYRFPCASMTFFLNEMHYFDYWYLHIHLGKKLHAREIAQLNQLYHRVAQLALAQPQVCVHRDYHSRNLMQIDGVSQPGILDFQDAVWGPMTYDLVSLLRDCYVDWDDERVTRWLALYYEHALSNGLLKQTHFKTFVRWFDYMGIQRHLKCVGIFSKLYERDQRSHYLQYLPRVLQYMKKVARHYADLSDLLPFLSGRGT